MMYGETCVGSTGTRERILTSGTQSRSGEPDASPHVRASRWMAETSSASKRMEHNLAEIPSGSCDTDWMLGCLYAAAYDLTSSDTIFTHQEWVTVHAASFVS